MKTPVGYVTFDLAKSIPVGEWRPGALCKHPQCGLGKVVAVDAQEKTATVYFLFWIANPDEPREPGIIFKQAGLTLLTWEEINVLRGFIDPLTTDPAVFEMRDPWFPPKDPLEKHGAVGEEPDA